MKVLFTPLMRSLLWTLGISRESMLQVLTTFHATVADRMSDSGHLAASADPLQDGVYYQHLGVLDAGRAWVIRFQLERGSGGVDFFVTNAAATAFDLPPDA